MESISNLINQGELSFPFIVAHGDKDEVTLPIGSELLYSQSTNKNKEINRIKDGFHDLLNGPQNIQVVNALITWSKKL
jgi:alpha-beta hydrolase superfamily lysophospholipase